MRRFLRAIQNGDLNCVKDMVTNFKFKRRELNRALVDAAEYGQVAIFELLIDKGADVGTRNYIVLAIAAKRGNVELLRFLFSSDMDMHVEEDIALCLAAESGHLDAVQYLLSIGADARARHDGALHLAAKGGNLLLISLLLEHGAEFNPLWNCVEKHVRQFCLNFEHSLGPKSAIKLC